MTLRHPAPAVNQSWTRRSNPEAGARIRAGRGVRMDIRGTDHYQASRVGSLTIAPDTDRQHDSSPGERATYVEAVEQGRAARAQGGGGMAPPSQIRRHDRVVE